MPDIHQLSPSVINKIAAGEVIERPASVVKELLENSVDAGATRIEVTLEKGGSELIRVADNGCGIKADQLLLAVASHATSKIREADDLFHVGTLGFRGEALASIAEVSRFLISSRTADSLAGAQLEVIGGQRSEIVPIGCNVGTTIEVRDLFFNTPVRRKFLRTPTTEIAHATEAFTRVALACPDRHFVLRHNERVVYDLPATTNWRERIAAFFGADVGQSLVAVTSSEGDIRLSGFVADPIHSRGNNRMQFVFLNGRCIRDRSLQHALSEAYRGLLLTGRFPIAFLRLEMPADLVDVNVHPTKMEVRFQDSGRIYSQLLSAIRRKFLATDLTARVGTPGATPLAAPHANVAASQPHQPSHQPSHQSPPAQQQSSGPTPASLVRPAASWESGDTGGVSGGAQVAVGRNAGTAVNPGAADRFGDRGSGSGGGGAGGDVAAHLPLHAAPGDFRLASTPATLPATPPLFDPRRADEHRRNVVAWAQGNSTVTAPVAPAHGVSGAPSPTSSGNAPQASIAAPHFATRWSDSAYYAHDDDDAPSPESLAPVLPAAQAPPASQAAPLATPLAVPTAAPARGLQLHNRYLVTEVDEGIIVIDQHALHERILYEQFRAKTLAGKLESQRMLVPEPVKLTPAEAAVALENREMLDEIGLGVEPFGGDTVLVTSYPAMLGHIGPGELLRQSIDRLMAGGKSVEGRDLVDELLHMMSCKAAVRAGDRLTPGEIDSLLAQRHLFQDTHHCPHGRPTALVFTQDELDKRFKRI